MVEFLSMTEQTPNSEERQPQRETIPPEIARPICWGLNQMFGKPLEGALLLLEIFDLPNYALQNQKDRERIERARAGLTKMQEFLSGIATAQTVEVETDRTGMFIAKLVYSGKDNTSPSQGASLSGDLKRNFSLGLMHEAGNALAPTTEMELLATASGNLMIKGVANQVFQKTQAISITIKELALAPRLDATVNEDGTITLTQVDTNAQT